VNDWDDVGIWAGFNIGVVF